MYCEYLIDKAKLGDVQAMEEFYCSNFGLMMKIANDHRLSDFDKDDFFQICYIAMDQAVKVFKHGDYSFLSYFRRCLIHFYYLHKLEMKYPMRVPRGKEVDYCSFEVLEYSDFDDKLEEVEQSVLAQCVWDEVRNSVNEFDYELLYGHFKQKKTYEDLSPLLGKTASQLRYRQRNVLRLLRKNKNLKELSREYF